MLANPFDYYIFRPISYDDFVAYFRKVLISAEQGNLIYNKWLYIFYRRLLLFYRSQYQRLQKSAEKEFRSLYDISDYYEIYDYDFKTKWEQFQDSVGLNRYYEEHRALGDEITRERDRINLWLKEYESTANTERVLSDEQPRPKEINALWFNFTICNDEVTILKLRELAYEFYLKTKHWAKIRAAQILIHKAVCQEQYCYGMGESWYGDDWEADLHVHHLTYKNRGNERYADIVLLCSSHHEQWHKTVDLFGESKMIFLDDE
jgi:hypothetical protein